MGKVTKLDCVMVAKEEVRNFLEWNVHADTILKELPPPPRQSGSWASRQELLIEVQMRETLASSAAEKCCEAKI